jgi:YHS domain-containing protein
LTEEYHSDKLDRNIFGIILIVAQREPEVTMTKDPVCGMQVDERKAAAKSMYEGKSYSFCSTECKAEFDKKPDKFVGKTK